MWYNGELFDSCFGFLYCYHIKVTKVSYSVLGFGCYAVISTKVTTNLFTRCMYVFAGQASSEQAHPTGARPCQAVRTSQVDSLHYAELFASIWSRTSCPVNVSKTDHRFRERVHTSYTPTEVSCQRFNLTQLPKRRGLMAITTNMCARASGRTPSRGQGLYRLLSVVHI